MLAIPVILFGLTASAIAAEDAPKDSKKKAEEPGTHVQMPFLIAPMSDNGKLLGYAYISSKLVASTPGASVEIRDKLAFIQDAFVRDVNAQPISKADDPKTVDNALLGARLVADAKRVVGAAKVVTITFTQIQFSPLHPSQTTQDAVPPSEVAPKAQAASTQQPAAAEPAKPKIP
ncbi:MAG TPA: hypothetical protein VMF58_03055 [Rhizomicrobium sp.]|nr:hypothetical protein [Rhizomicrobium sp.]